MQIINKNIDFFSFKFSIIYPLFYAFMPYFFASSKDYLVLFTIIALAELNFGVKWRLFIFLKHLKSN
jgi:hypothetical protein